MTSPSNLYAEKVFAEHPLALWTLDDKADYLSLISEANRDMSLWTKSGGTATLSSAVAGQPFDATATSTLSNSSGSSVMKYTSPSLFVPTSTINSEMSSISIGINVYDDNQDINSIEVGYSDGTTEYLQSFQVTTAKDWVHLLANFETVSLTSQFKVVIRVTLQDATPATMLVNGITVGQWSESFEFTSLGVSTANTPSTIAIPSVPAITAFQYGLEQNNGYYLVQNSKILARNASLPMVYGSKSVTALSPSTNGSPSMILPAFGFLSDAGRYRDYTFEAWLRINSEASEPKRIIGPIGSDDGLYVDGPFLTLKIGDALGSHYVAEWYRPMLVHFGYTDNVATLMVNGETVVTLDVDMSSINLPALNNSSGLNQDFIGFYAYSDVPGIDIDCPGVYSYRVPAQMAKRRWVYGQGVQFPENLNSAYSGTSMSIDYTFSDYTSNYSYPDLGNWVQGIVENVEVKDNVLSAPSYQLPTIEFDNQTYAAWQEDLSDVSSANGPRLSLIPNSDWANTNGYIKFSKLNITKQPISAIYGVYQIDRENASEQILFKIDDDVSGSYFVASLIGTSVSGYTISYNFKYGSSGEEKTLYSVSSQVLNDNIYAGINFKDFASFFGGNVASFFGNRDRLKLYVGGSRSFEKTFSGNILRFGFCNARNFNKVAGAFSYFGVLGADQLVFDGGDSYFGNSLNNWEDIADGGTPSQQPLEDMVEHIASYTLLVRDYFGNLVLDIAADSYWEDYVPLSYFGKNVSTKDGELQYGLDFIQFNFDYPKPISVTGNYYNTSNSMVKTYVTFQYISSGANNVSSSFTTTVGAPKNNVVTPGSSWLTTKYEVVDGTVIYPPAGVDFKDLAIAVSIEFATTGILYQPIKIRSLHLSSKALDALMPNPIGTRSGTQMFPYKKTGFYFDYKAKNPFTIYRGSTPYLYLTRNSGIRPVGDFVSTENRGITTPVNAKQSSDYKITAIQTSIMFDDQAFPDTAIQILELESNKSHIKFYLESVHPTGKRGRIYAINAATGQVDSSSIFYLNGSRVSNPVISVGEWNVLSVGFINGVDFSGETGGLRVNGPVIVNNLSYYQETGIQKAKSGLLRQWYGVKFSGQTVRDWDYWDLDTWEEVLVISPESYYGVNPEDLYNSYAGTNKIIIGDTKQFTIGNYQYTAYKDIQTQSEVVIPV